MIKTEKSDSHNTTLIVSCLGNRRPEESESPTEDQGQTSRLAQMSAFNRTELDDSPLINHEISSNHSSNSDENEARCVLPVLYCKVPLTVVTSKTR